MTKTVQVLFLLDVSSSLVCWDDVEKFNHRVRVIRLSCLKILTYFLHRSTRDSNSYATIRWNYKYYSSLSSGRIKTPIRRTFREFNVDEFDEFEEQMSRRLKCERDLSVQNGYKTSISTPCSSNIPSSHAERLNAALKEILCDFMWDSPDITSPVQKRKRGKTVEDVNDETKRDNFVFVVSKCPCTLDELKLFLNWESSSHKGKSRSLNSETAFQHLMSTNVFSTYKNNFKIRVFWLDLGENNFLVSSEDVRGREIISEIFKKLLGKIIQISNILHLSEYHSLANESLMDFYFGSTEKLIPRFQSSLNWEHSDLNCVLEFIPLETETRYIGLGITLNQTEIHRVFVCGLIKKRLFADPDKISFVCVANDNSEIFSTLLLFLSRHELFIVVNCNGNVGILYPMSPTVGALDFVDLKNKNMRLDECREQLTSPTTGSRRKVPTPDNVDWTKYLNDLSYPLVPVIEATKSDNCQLPVFAFNFINAWFVPRSLSCDLVATHDQKVGKIRELELFEKLRQRQQAKSSPDKPTLDELLPPTKRRPKLSRKLRGHVSQRTQSLLLNARQQAVVFEEDTTFTKKMNNSGAKEERINNLLKTFDTDDEEKLVIQVKEYYKTAIDTDLSLIVSATNIVNVIMFHVSEKYGKRREKSCKDLLEKQLFKTATGITDEYKQWEGTKNTARSREFELQSLLRMEALIAIDNVTDVNKFVDEAIALLKKLSLYSGISHLSQFLTEIILPSYIRTKPQSIVQIFEELNQPIPAELESNSSDSEATLGSNFTIDPLESESISSSHVSSPREMQIQRRHSTSRLGGGQTRVLQITAQERAKFISKPRATSKRSDKRSVCRSLFTGTEVQRKKKISTESIKRRVLKTNRVMDTPIHKQVSNAIIRKQASRRKQIPDSVTTVKETPSKELSSSQRCNSFQANFYQSPNKCDKFRLRRTESSPGKLNSSQGETELEIVISTPVTKNETSPSPLTIPSLTGRCSETSSPSRINSGYSPEIDLWDARETSIYSDPCSPLLFSDNEYSDLNWVADDAVKCSAINDGKLKPVAFDKWRIKKPCSENFARESTKRRKSESDSPYKNGVDASVSPLYKKMCYSGIMTPVKRDSVQILNKDSVSNGSSRRVPFTSPTSLSLLHLMTSPVMRKK